MQDQEEDCLHYCYKLNVEDFDDVKTGYSISFHFKENPYFENEVITKEYHLASENQSNSDFTQSSTSTPIKWKEGKDLLKELQSKPQANKKRDIETKSFFDWFCDNSDPMDDMAELIKDDIWPNPLQYFLVPDIGVYNEEDSVGDEDDEINGSGVEDGKIFPISQWTRFHDAQYFQMKTKIAKKNQKTTNEHGNVPTQSSMSEKLARR